GKYSFSPRHYPYLKTIIIKGNIEDLDADAFSSSEVSYTIVFLSTTEPPKISHNSHTLCNSENLNFYVPDESVERYKKATVWSNQASSIYPLSEYPEILP
ncbi:MAG: hypothetical protein K2F89_00675, partial [Treponemataceae bacterium]|nr:hypothetical protein [Treponemataceae bacterium]